MTPTMRLPHRFIQKKNNYGRKNPFCLIIDSGRYFGRTGSRIQPSISCSVTSSLIPITPVSDIEPPPE